MCEQCDAVSRRTFLKIGTTAAIAGAIAGCAPNSPPHAVENLPDAYYQDHLVQGAAGGTSTAPIAPVQIDPKQIITPPPMPPAQTDLGKIMPRAAWTRSPLSLRDGAPMDGITRLTIHHTGDGKPFMGESTDDVARHLQVVQQAHLQRGMIDIAYHFALDRTGRVWQLRWLQYEGQHVRNSRNGTRNNAHNIGVVVLGDFNLQSVTVVQRDRLLEFVRLVRSKYPTIAAVSMHGELVETDCPGKALRPMLAEARRRGIL